MAISLTATWIFPLLLLAAIQDCIGNDSLNQHDSILVATMKQVSQSLQYFSDTMQEGLLLHKHNNEILTSQQSLHNAVSNVNQEIIAMKSQIEKIFQKVERRNQDNSELKSHHESKNQVMVQLTQFNIEQEDQLAEFGELVETKTEEIQELNKLLAEKDKVVEIQAEVIQELKKILAEKDNVVETQTEEIQELKKLLAEKDKVVQDLDTRLGVSQRHIQQQEDQVTQLNETVKSSDVCKATKNLPQHGRIKELVQAFSSNGDWDEMKEGLKALLDNSSVEYRQLQSAGSVWAVGYRGYAQLASLLLCAGMPVDMSDRDGVTLLIGAAQGGQIQLVKMLLDRGANVNSKGYNDFTPLMLVAYRGHLDIVRVLVQDGADTTAKDNRGYTPLDWAISGDRTAVVQYLEQLPH